MDKMNRIESIFGFGKLQGFLTILNKLETSGLSIDDLRSHVDNRRNEMAIATKGTPTPTKTCPCGGTMMLQRVNTGPKDQTGDDSKSVWMCGKCGECEYTNDTIEQITEELNTRSA